MSPYAAADGALTPGFDESAGVLLTAAWLVASPPSQPSSSNERLPLPRFADDPRRLEIRPVEVINGQDLEGRNRFAFVIDGPLAVEEVRDVFGDHREVTLTGRNCVGERYRGGPYRYPPVAPANQ